MKRVLEIVVYLSNCLNAISKGAQVAHDNWPANNPFGKSVPAANVSEQPGGSAESSLPTTH